MDATEHFGKTLRQLRKARNISAAELASSLHCSPSLVYNIEKGRNSPQPELIVRAAEYFGVTADYLLVGIFRTEENEIVELYRGLSEEGRLIISLLLKLLKTTNSHQS